MRKDHGQVRRSVEHRNSVKLKGNGRSGILCNGVMTNPTNVGLQISTKYLVMRIPFIISKAEGQRCEAITNRLQSAGLC